MAGIAGLILVLIGVSDLTQTRHSLKRNYPVMANSDGWPSWSGGITPISFRGR